ncbi:hypothetical protein [Streptomyces sp. NPDC058964]|uniref:hypothetical protein n=1 Tax=Streptomyces sp. NPDC058964 TaxID=3346681 RepID=UPI0036BC08B0
MPTDTGELAESPFFGGLTVGRCAQQITYTADSYADLLLTCSGRRALTAPGPRG